MSQQIEDRLRSALRAEAEGLRLSPDAWQENQRRVSAAASGRSRRVLTIAAVTLAVTTMVGGIAFVGGGGLGDGAASGTGDPFTNEHLLGPPVEAETLTLDGQQTVHTIALSDMTGKGPNLCDEYEQVVVEGADSPNSSSGSGSCTPRDPAADDDDVAFDWLTGTEGSGDIRGVTAGVDSRVSKVQIWMDNGDMVLATLHPTGWDDTTMFALTTQPPEGPTAQRLVAYGRDGRVVQAVDLSARFGREWLPSEPDCGNRADAPTLTYLLGPDGAQESATVRLGHTTALIHIVTSAGTLDSSHCVDLRPDSLSSASVAGSIAVVILGPEVENMRVRVAGADAEVELLPADRSPWRVAVVRLPSSAAPDDAEATAFDSAGNALQEAGFSEVRSGGEQNVTQE